MSLQQMVKGRIKYFSPRCGGIAAGAVEAGVEIVKTNISDPQEIEAVIKALEAVWVHFDHAGDGFAVRTGWVGRGDGLLVWDRNGDGVIDSGQ